MAFKAHGVLAGSLVAAKRCIASPSFVSLEPVSKTAQLVE
jgi:hypothetical protein